MGRDADSVMLRSLAKVGKRSQKPEPQINADYTDQDEESGREVLVDLQYQRKSVFICG
jgi:hypothetical protein